jgi:hypothetical protein
MKNINPKIIFGLIIVTFIFLSGFVVSLIDQSKKPVVSDSATTSSLSIQHNEGADDYLINGLVIGDNPIPDSQKETWIGIVTSPSIDQVASNLSTQTSMSLEEIKQAMVDSLQTGVLVLKP